MVQIKQKYILPVIVGLGIIAVMALFAYTDVADPVIEYIHTNSITPLGAILCFVATVVAFYIVYKLLAKLGASLLPENDPDDTSKNS